VVRLGVAGVVMRRGHDEADRLPRIARHQGQRSGVDGMAGRDQRHVVTGGVVDAERVRQQQGVQPVTPQHVLGARAVEQRAVHGVRCLRSIVTNFSLAFSASPGNSRPSRHASRARRGITITARFRAIAASASSAKASAG